LVCVDYDPVVVAYSKAILAGNASAAIITADLAVLHVIADADDPWRIVARLRDALAPGSYLVLCHATSESKPAVTQAIENLYTRSVTTGSRIRSRAQILRFFDGFRLVDPGWSTCRNGARIAQRRARRSQPAVGPGRRGTDDLTHHQRWPATVSR
jgi:S-adenosyl methyltransferase